jgi:GNAT superfamily N-acetyltransferase
MTATVRTRPMTPQEYADYRARSIPAYADDLQRARGMSREDALARSTETFAPTLAEAATEGSWVLRVLDEADAPVGWLWLGPHPSRADAVFVYDVEIDQAHRGRGLGRATLLEAERIAREAGLTGISLNVFGWNHGAETLYRSLGYEVSATQMTKRLQEGS